MSDQDRLQGLPDRDLAARYWEARADLLRLRDTFRREDGAASYRSRRCAERFRRLRELEAVCERLWRESRRRTHAGSIGGLGGLV